MKFIDEPHYFVNWRKVSRDEFMYEAAVAGAEDFRSAKWSMFNDDNGTLRSCVVGDSMFITFSPVKPCLN